MRHGEIFLRDPPSLIVWLFLPRARSVIGRGGRVIEGHGKRDTGGVRASTIPKAYISLYFAA